MSKFAKLSQVKKNAEDMKKLLAEDLENVRGGDYYVYRYGLPPDECLPPF